MATKSKKQNLPDGEPVFIGLDGEEIDLDNTEEEEEEIVLTEVIEGELYIDDEGNYYDENGNPVEVEWEEETEEVVETEEDIIYVTDDGSYVDKDGNPVTLPEDEEIRYIDEDGNETFFEESGEFYTEGTHNTNKCYVDGRSIVFDFHQIFGRDDLDYCNTFHINKRCYYQIPDLIAQDYNLIIENCPSFIFYLLECKKLIMDERLRIEENLMEGLIAQGKKPKVNPRDIDRLINTREIVEKLKEVVNEDNVFEFIDQFVEDNYTLDLNSMLQTNNKNLENAITDERNKVILKTSVVSRLLVPCICEGNIHDKDTFIIFKMIMNKFDGDRLNTSRKLYAFIKPRVNRTLYPDKVIWNFLSQRAIDAPLFIRTLVRIITIGIITKLQYNTSTVSYFDVILREKVHFLFTYKYRWKYKTIKPSEEELDDTEKLKIHMLSIDRSIPIVNDISIEDIIAYYPIPEKYEWLLDIPKERWNTYTTKLLQIYYDGKCNVLLSTVEQRVKLILIMRERMLKAGFKIFPEIIVREVIPNEKRISNRKKLNEKITSSEYYTDFLYEYGDVMNIIMKANPLIQLITAKNMLFVNEKKELLEIDETQLSNDIFKITKFRYE